MEFQVFQEQIAEEVRRQAKDGCRVSIEEVEKNNGVVRMALCIFREQAIAAPMIYLEEFYRQYREGVPVRQIAEVILEQYHRLDTQMLSVRTSAFTDFLQAGAQIYCRLIHAGKNERLLCQVPHERYLDLAVVYYYQVKQGETFEGTILIRENHRELWGVSRELLSQKAWENTLRDKRAVFENLGNVLKMKFQADLASVPDADEDEDMELPLYVLSNESYCSGAVCIRYPGVLSGIGDRLERDFYVIPSSIHECLILPDDGKFTFENLSLMVREVNESQLNPQEILSDHVYYFDRARGILLAEPINKK